MGIAAGGLSDIPYPYEIEEERLIQEALNKPQKIAVFAGSFDPFTTGHLWMIKQGIMLFDKLIVVVATNPEKRYMFSVNDRLEMLQQSVKQLSTVKVSSLTNRFLVTHVHAENARFILRGIRNERDYGYEREMRNINGDLDSKITTVFLSPPRELAEVSSSMVRGLIGLEGWEDIVKNYIPNKTVLQKIIKEIHQKQEEESKQCWAKMKKEVHNAKERNA